MNKLKEQEQAKEQKQEIMRGKENMGKHSSLTNNCRDNLSSTKRKKYSKENLLPDKAFISTEALLS